MKVADVSAALEEIAPVAGAAEWDNVGLLIGDAHRPVRTLLLCIDLTAEVLDEARRAAAEMVMAYHPPIFKPVSRLTRAAAPVVYEAARRGVSVYSMHTALDVAPGGTNDALAGALALCGTRPLEPLEAPAKCKIVVFTPEADIATVSRAAFDAGAGHIGQYAECSFRAEGTGTFRGGSGTSPAVGKAQRFEQTPELRLELICPAESVSAVASAVTEAHSYEQPAIDIYPLHSLPGATGQGRIGTLRPAATVASLVKRAKSAANAKRVLVAGPQSGKVRTAACAAGSAGGLVRAAAAAGATFYLTGELRHHDALAAAASGMTVVCVGHWNSERLALPALGRRIRKLLPRLKVLPARTDRDPFNIV